MTEDREDEFRTLWQSQKTGVPQTSPDELRQWAATAEARARRSVLVNQLSAGIVVAISIAGLFVLDSGLLGKAGTVMLLVSGIYAVWAFPHFFAAIPTPSAANAETCAAVYKRQLERQRDMNLSARSMGPVLFPAMVLLTLNRHWPDADTYVGPQEWGATIFIVASFYFLMQLVFFWTDALAHRFQLEIDEIESMTTRSGPESR